MSTLLHPADTLSDAHSLPDAPSSSSSSSSSRSLILSSIRGMLSLTWPVSLSYLLQFTLGLVNLSFVGHLSADYLAGAALGNMFVNVGGYSIIYGLAASIDTLCSQAYGAGNYKHVGLVAQRAATCLVLWSQCEQLLTLAKQDATVAAIAGSYVRRLMPGLIPNVLFEVIKRWLQTQQIMKPMMIIGICTNLVHAFLCWLLVFRLNLGFSGAPIAMCLAQYVMLTTGIIIVYCFGLHRQTWPTFSFRELFRGWGQLIRLGIPGMLMLCLEWWSFELCAFFAGWIGTTELDAFVVALNILAFCYMLPLGISVSAATLIGNHLGANKAIDAKYACYGAICLTICTQISIALTLFLLRSSLGKAYSNDEKVISLLAQVIPLVCAMVSFDGYSAVTGGILRGTGKQSVGATVNLGSYYLFGLPLVLLLIHQAHLGIFGIWIGLGSAVTLTSLIQSAYIARIDWQRECTLAIDRARDPHSQAGSYAKISTTAEIPMMELELDDEEEEQGTRMSPSHRRETVPNDDEMDALSLITVKATEDEPEHESARHKKITPRIINVEEKENEDGKKKEIRNGTLHPTVPPIGIPQPPISPQTTDGLSVRKATSFRAEWDLDSEDEARMEGDEDVDMDVDLDDDELLSDEQV